MNINFNNVRLQACIAYDKLCNKLNRAIKDKSFSPEIIIDPEDIQEEMNDLRMMIGTIAMTYQEGEEGFKDVYAEEYPEGKSMQEFNPEEE